MAWTAISATQEAEAGMGHTFQASTEYRMGSKPAWALTLRDLASKEKEKVGLGVYLVVEPL